MAALQRSDASAVRQTDLDTCGRFWVLSRSLSDQTEQRMSSAAVPRPAAPGPWARIQDLILPIGMIASILVIMVPVPAELMDLLLAANITIAVIMLLTTLYVRTPLEFNIFPSLLLATTLFRLVLNVATTRLILTRAAQRRPAGGRRRGADLRRVRHRRRHRHRQDRRRPDHLLDHRPDPVRGHHQGRHAHQRGGRPIHPRRHARQADGHRRRPERRHRSTSARPSAAGRRSPSRPTSSARWTVPASSSAATPSPASSSF